ALPPALPAQRCGKHVAACRFPGRECATHWHLQLAAWSIRIVSPQTIIGELRINSKFGVFSIKARNLTRALENRAPQISPIPQMAAKAAVHSPGPLVSSVKSDIFVHLSSHDAKDSKFAANSKPKIEIPQTEILVSVSG